MVCTNCKSKCDSMKTMIRHGKVVTGCEHCSGGIIQGNELSPKHYRESMKRTYAKDIVQPIEPRDFIKAYGIEKSREFYNDETIRKFS